MRETDIDKLSKDDFVPPSQAVERGYYGYTPDDTPNEDYTVAGVTRLAAAQAAEKPAARAKSATKPEPAKSD